MKALDILTRTFKIAGKTLNAIAFFNGLDSDIQQIWPEHALITFRFAHHLFNALQHTQMLNPT